jgi:alpha-amylase
MKKNALLFLIPLLLITTVTPAQKKKAAAPKEKMPFIWEGANLYFLMTDRFYDGNAKKETYLNRSKPTGKLRGFEGGNLKGIIKKLDEGYFDKLGTNAIWFTPIVEQIHDGVDAATGMS